MDELGEFQAAMQRAGIAVPEDLLQGSFAVHLELRRMAKLIRTNLGPDVEPASVFLVNPPRHPEK